MNPFMDDKKHGHPSKDSKSNQVAPDTSRKR